MILSNKWETVGPEINIPYSENTYRIYQQVDKTAGEHG